MQITLQVKVKQWKREGLNTGDKEQKRIKYGVSRLIVLCDRHEYADYIENNGNVNLRIKYRKYPQFLPKTLLIILALYSWDFTSQIGGRFLISNLSISVSNWSLSISALVCSDSSRGSGHIMSGVAMATHYLHLLATKRPVMVPAVLKTCGSSFCVKAGIQLNASQHLPTARVLGGSCN